MLTGHRTHHLIQPISKKKIFRRGFLRIPMSDSSYFGYLEPLVSETDENVKLPRILDILRFFMIH